MKARMRFIDIHPRFTPEILTLLFSVSSSSDFFLLSFNLWIGFEYVTVYV